MRRLVVLAVFFGVIAAVVLVLFTPVIGVRHVEVLGVRELGADDVRTAAAVEPGTPLVRLDTRLVAERVKALPRVASVEVERSYPGTVEVTVVERTPVAMTNWEDGVHLVDGTGMDYAVVPTAPAGLPLLSAGDDASTKAAVTVLAAVPEQLRGQVASIDAPTAASVKLTLSDGRVVKWGGVESGERKAAVLGPLMTRKGTVFDVAAPDFPTVA